MTDVLFLNDGMNGRVYVAENGHIIKVQKRNSLGHDIMTQKRIHLLAERLINDLDLRILRVPHVYFNSTNSYEMDYIYTKNIIYLGDPNHGYTLHESLHEKLSQELAILWIELFKAGFAAWDFELYLQLDGTVMLVDFDKFGFHMTSGPVSILMPSSRRHSSLPHLHYFFQNPCFPHDFVERLRANGFEPPADCLPSIKNED